jgi:CRP-like cAMP-binding protein
VHDLVEPEAVLGAVGLLRYCSARHLARIGALAAPLEVPAATVVVTAGARDVPLVLVLGGVARAEGHDRDAFRIGPGAQLGVDTLLDGGPAAWTVTAVTGMRLGVIERRNFLELLVADPVIARRILVAVREDLDGGGGH